MSGFSFSGAGSTLVTETFDLGVALAAFTGVEEDGLVERVGLAGIIGFVGATRVWAFTGLADATGFEVCTGLGAATGLAGLTCLTAFAGLDATAGLAGLAVFPDLAGFESFADLAGFTGFADTFCLDLAAEGLAAGLPDLEAPDLEDCFAGLAGLEFLPPTALALAFATFLEEAPALAFAVFFPLSGEDLVRLFFLPLS
jgi:hypothetical protein